MAPVSDILQCYPADCRPSRVEPLGSAGGLSGAQFWRVVAPRGTLVLRRWPIEHPTPEKLQFIHAVLRHAADRGMTILPVPIATADGATYVAHDGHLWELTPWLAGVADYETSPADTKPSKLRAAMSALAQLHVATSDFPTAGDLRVAGAAPSVTSRLARLPELQSGGIANLQGAVDPNIWPELTPLAHQFLDVLPSVLPKAIAQLAPLADKPLPLQPCIRDIWHDHVLFEGERVSGLVDFGAMQVDTPATDIARLLGSLVGDDKSGWQIGLAAYQTVRPLSADELHAVPALDASSIILAGCNWIGWIYIEHRQFLSRETITARLKRLATRIQRLS
jgi:Ser/Thr protein kinase RdoA (MazF antagonist)